MVPVLTGWIIAALMVVLVAVTVVLLTIPSFRHRAPAGGRWLRLPCPGDGAEAQIRVGTHPATRQLSVLWCDRFGDGPITCNRACFTAEIAAIAAA